MSIFLVECLAYLVIGVMAVIGKWQILTIFSFVGLVLVWGISFLAESRMKKWIPLVAVAQMLVGMLLMVVTPGVMLAAYVPVVVLFVLLGVCSLLINAELEAAESPRIPSKR